ncbi:MAG: hypothetical protein GY870_12425 [archaeon]|nr:hypothetical protein [archaeon]
MPNYMDNYVEKWIREGQHIKKGVKRFSPTGWSFVSFMLPLMAVPLAVKGATYAAKAIKKELDKR